LSSTGVNPAQREPGSSPDFLAGLAHYQAGRLDRAETLFRKTLRKSPKDPYALQMLGETAAARGRTDFAQQLIRQALEVMPDNPEALVSLGNVLRAIGRPAEAEEQYRCAIGLRPDFAVAHCNLAAALNDQEAFEKALESAIRAVELMPGLAEAQLARGVALVGLRRFAEAETPYRLAIALAPTRAMTRSDLGLVLTELGRFEEAMESHRQAIEMAPADAGLHFALGKTLFEAHELAASEASHRRAHSLTPSSAVILAALGGVLRAQGRFQEARTCFRQALELDPDLPEAHYRLALTGTDLNEAELQRLRTVFGSTDHHADDRITAGFALGTMFDRTDRFDEAFSHFRTANAWFRDRRAAIGERFDHAAFRGEADGLIERCDKALFAKVADWGSRSEVPVFIVGMPRSGTSLVEQIAASHSQVFGAGERKEVPAISTALLRHNQDRPIDQWDRDHARQLADEYVALLSERGGGRARVTDKMPDNSILLGVIAALFPAARVIYCQRDLRDVCLSCYFTLFGEPLLWSYDLADCALRALEIERLMAHWQRVLPLSILTVKYEALVDDPEAESRRLIDFLGLDWEPACLDFHRTQRPVLTASSWQVRQPLFTRSAGRWRHYEQHIGPLQEVLATGLTTA
jgi:tetratricopeptide (TPR) repeat protein